MKPRLTLLFPTCFQSVACLFHRRQTVFIWVLSGGIPHDSRDPGRWGVGAIFLKGSST